MNSNTCIGFIMTKPLLLQTPTTVPRFARLLQCVSRSAHGSGEAPSRVFRMIQGTENYLTTYAIHGVHKAPVSLQKVEVVA